ncbi:MAG: RAMP superfamily CRISPR-associated protein [Candidatus Eremiobacterota bacterium]
MTKGKIVLKGIIELLSPTLTGSGDNDFSDIDVLVDSDGKPLIPATSFTGVLKHYLKIKDHKKELEDFWGYTTKTTGKQSALRCSDLNCISNYNLSVRDGIRIDNKKGIVEDKGKYDYEIIDPGARFSLTMEVDYTEDTESFVKGMVATIYTELENHRVRVGAKTNNGLGKIKLSDRKIYDFNFSDKKDNKDNVIKWLKKDFSSPSSFSVQPFEIERKVFTIDATFDIKSSLLIRSYSSDPAEADSVHIMSGDKHVIPGSSLKGAIRARAERIVKTLSKDTSLLTELFGIVDDKNRSKKSKRGRIRVEEVVLPRFISEINTRIKIDRFTGGTIEGALFDSKPLYTNFRDKVQNVKITVMDYKEHEPGLLLLVLKDLWTGDIAIGGEKNIGRGVLQGCNAIIDCGDKPVILDNDFSKLSIDDKNKLEELVKAFSDYAGGGNN